MAHLLNDVLELAEKLASALAPSAIGAAIGQIHERGLAWRDRLLAYINGICVSYYVTLGLTSWAGLDQFVSQAIAFLLAMIAFKATPRFISSASDAIGTVPEVVKGWLDRFGNKSK